MPNVKVNVNPNIDPLVKVNPACGRHREAPETEASPPTTAGKFHADLERETRQAWKEVQEERKAAPKATEDKPADKPKKKESRAFGRKKGKR